jgi:hypothetical protein
MTSANFCERRRRWRSTPSRSTASSARTGRSKRATILFTTFAAMKVIIDLFAIRAPRMARVEQSGVR